MLWRNTLTGSVSSKKNSRILAKVRGRMINIPSKQYKAWHDQAMLQIKRIPEPISEPCKITVQMWFKDKRRTDLDNRYASISDLLQDAEIISDDCWKVVREIHCYAMGVDKDNPHVDIQVETLDKSVDNPPPMC